MRHSFGWLAAWAVAGGVPALEAQEEQKETGPPLTISGYVTASYTYSSKHDGGTIVGRYYERHHDQFTLNAAKIALEKPISADKVSAGFRIDALFGQNAEVTKAAGLDLGTNGDLTQAYAVLNLPAGQGGHVQLRAGKYATPMGYEVIEDPVNPNFSEGNLFVFVENFTQTGMGLFADWPKVSFQLHVLNGWDVVKDNNSRKSFMARLGLTPSPAVSLAFLGYVGAEQADTTNHRYGGEFLGTFKVSPRVSLVGQFDYGAEEGLLAPSTDKATWWGGSVWVVADLSPKTQLAVRGDLVNDKNGVRTSNYFYPAAAARKFGSGTATLTIKTVEHLLIRPEVRFDHSNQADYGPAATPSKNQVTFALGTSYLF